jgi:hypothetical protein
MADIVNLNRARKKKRSAEKEKAAEENRVKFGRTRAEKSKLKSDGARFERHLDAHQLDTDE